MPKIPSVTQLRREVPQGARPIATLDTRGVGAPMAELGSVLEDIADKRLKYEVSKAETEFLIQKTKLDNSFDDDEDYGTIPERYESSVMESLSTLGSKISHPAARQAFMNKYKVSAAQGLERMRDLSRAKEKDYERGDITSRLEQIRESGLTGDIAEANATAKTLLDSAVSMGFYGAEEKAKLYSRFREDMAIGKLKMMKPENRTEALKQPWAKELPSDTRAELLRAAEEETLAGKAINIVDRVMDKGLDRDLAFEEFEKIRDPKLRAETERRFNYRFGQQRQAEVERQDAIMDQYYWDVREGNKTIDDIGEDFYLLSPANQETLAKAQEIRHQGRQYSDLDVIDNLNYLRHKKDFVSLREYYLNNASRLTSTDAKAWSKVSIEGAMPVEIKSLFTAQQMMREKLESVRLGKNKQARADLSNALNDWYQGYQEENQKLPTDAERDKKINDLLIEYDTSWWWGGNKRRYEMTDDDMQDAIGRLKEDEPDLHSDTLEYFKRLNFTPTPGQFLDVFNSLKESRSGAQ